MKGVSADGFPSKDCHVCQNQIDVQLIRASKSSIKLYSIYTGLVNGDNLPVMQTLSQKSLNSLDISI